MATHQNTTKMWNRKQCAKITKLVGLWNKTNWETQKIHKEKGTQVTKRARRAIKGTMSRSKVCEWVLQQLMKYLTHQLIKQIRFWVVNCNESIAHYINRTDYPSGSSLKHLVCCKFCFLGLVFSAFWQILFHDFFCMQCLQDKSSTSAARTLQLKHIDLILSEIFKTSNLLAVTEALL